MKDSPTIIEEKKNICKWNDVNEKVCLLYCFILSASNFSYFFFFYADDQQPKDTDWKANLTEKWNDFLLSKKQLIKLYNFSN